MEIKDGHKTPESVYMRPTDHVRPDICPKCHRMASHYLKDGEHICTCTDLSCGHLYRILYEPSNHDCTVCGVPVYEGDDPYATTGGSLDSCGGFIMDDCAWNTIACESCGEKISVKIEQLGEHIRKGVLQR